MYQSLMEMTEVVPLRRLEAGTPTGREKVSPDIRAVMRLGNLLGGRHR
jgi:hypothetical protein